MNTHPPIKHIQSVTLLLYIYFGWLMGWEVGGDQVVGGFIEWVGGGVGGWRVHGVGSGGVGGWRVHGVVGVWWCGWWWDGLLEGSWGGCIYSPTHEQLQC